VSSYDLVVRGGTVVDGSGAPRYRADVGVRAGRIVSIGRIRDRGVEEIDAEGQFVTPGFIDGHTHLDAQVNWDPLGTSVCWHGVTSVIMGNCGFTIAPCRDGERDLVLRSLERAEDISREAMLAGIRWEWETFSQYLDVVDRLPKGINHAAYIGHSALRTYVMGERAFEEAANPGDLAAMQVELSAALQAGAVGFSTSRSSQHATSDDKPVASRLASWDEVCTLVGTMGDLGVGLFELTNETHPPGEGRADYFSRIRSLAVDSGRPTLFMLNMMPTEPDLWKERLAFIDESSLAGGRMYAQVHTREFRSS
jgi:N-acyl-D-aspartate/D-glutamate deacylase